MGQYTDMIGASVQVVTRPTRIVSLVPSQTELLYDFGLEAEVVGITKFCVHPEAWFRGKTRVGGTKNGDLNKLRALCPDLVLANKEENDREQIAEISKFCPVWTSDITNLEEACRMISEVGKITGRDAEAQRIIDRILEESRKLERTEAELRVLYLIWREPWMTVGGDTFISDLIGRVGWQNVVAQKSRYPVLTNEDIRLLRPDLVLLSSEPFPFKPKHIEELQLLLPYSRFELVDGEMFSWYGSRLQLDFPYFQALIDRLKN